MSYTTANVQFKLNLPGAFREALVALGIPPLDPRVMKMKALVSLKSVSLMSLVLVPVTMGVNWKMYQWWHRPPILCLQRSKGGTLEELRVVYHPRGI